MRIPGIPFHQGRNNYVDGDGLHFGIAIHNTSNTASDENESSYADHRTDGTSSHFYVDGDSVTQSLDTDRKAGHAGSATGNNNAIAFELTGTNGKTRQWWLDNIAWSKLGYVIAYILQHDPDYRGFQVRRATVAEMKSNPRVKAFYSHNDMRLAWGGTTHDDPGPNFPWDRLFQAVNTAMSGASVATTEEPDLDAAQSKRLTNTDQALYALAMLDRTQDYVDEVPGATRELPLVDLLTGVRDEVHAMHEVIGSVFNPTDAGAPVSQATLEAAFLAVLQSPAGKAAIVAAVNEAEDS